MDSCKLTNNYCNFSEKNIASDPIKPNLTSLTQALTPKTNDGDLPTIEMKCILILTLACSFLQTTQALSTVIHIKSARPPAPQPLAPGNDITSAFPQYLQIGKDATSAIQLLQLRE